MNKILDYVERAFLVLLSATFMNAVLLHVWAHPYLISLALSECLPVVLIIIRRPGEMVNKPLPFVLAFIGTAAPLLVRPAEGGLHLLPESIVTTLMMLGLGLNVSAKFALWRSFGLAPANRGIRAGGPYRFIRHPMYVGYFINQFAFLLANLTIGNLVKYLLTWSVQFLRVREEEKFLMQDQQYRDLAMRVRFRLLPGIY